MNDSRTASANSDRPLRASEFTVLKLPAWKVRRKRGETKDGASATGRPSSGLRKSSDISGIHISVIDTSTSQV